MNRQEFLAQPEVNNFIDWLIKNLPGMVFKLKVLPSKFVPAGLDVEVVGIEAVLTHYTWHTQWNDKKNGQIINSGDWSSTRESLLQLRTLLNTALDSGDETQALEACLAVLQWGGVRGAIPFLKRLEAEGRLISYLGDLIPLMTLNGQQSLEQLNDNSVLRFDAGLTKIHALLDESGSPIYDSRVGAAMAMLYALYRADQSNSTDSLLKFPSGPARGKQIRNPGQLGFDSAPQFFTRNVSSVDWARWQVKLGWLLSAVLERTDWFGKSDKTSLRLHAFEASLFMLGYDLQSMHAVRTKLQPNGSNDEASKALTWVPTGHNLSNVLDLFFLYHEKNTHNPSIPGFRDWLVEEGVCKKSTANSYLFPLRANEFDLINCNLNQLEEIRNGGQPGLFAAYNNDKFRLGEERESICLVSAWLAGRCCEIQASQGTRPIDLLIKGGFAGTPQSATTLLYVGRCVGRHFGLLDENNLPTNLFSSFFSDELSDFDHRLSESRFS